MQTFAPHVNTDEETNEFVANDRYHLITVLGMMAVFSGNTRCPLSALVITYEMANVAKTRADFVFPSLAACAIAYVTSIEVESMTFYDAVGATDSLEDDGDLDGEGGMNGDNGQGLGLMGDMD